MPLIKASLADSVGTVSFDRDAKRNALSAGLIAETIAALDDFKARRARAVVLRSATAGKVWSATISRSCPRPTSTRCPTATRWSSFCAR